jgi:hypothetical protein
LLRDALRRKCRMYYGLREAGSRGARGGAGRRFFFAILTTSDMLIFIPSSQSQLNFTCLEV